MHFSAIFIVAFVLITAVPAAAEIHSRTDTYDGTKYLSSSIADLDILTPPVFGSELTVAQPADRKRPTDCFLMFEVKFYREQDRVLSAGKIEIDGRSYNITITDLGEGPHRGRHIGIDALPLLTPLCACRSGSLRLFYERSGAVEWNIPDQVLAEWRAVIARAKKEKLISTDKKSKKLPAAPGGRT